MTIATAMDKVIPGGKTGQAEFKPSLSQEDQTMESVSAFSGTRGVTILTGVTDRGNVQP